MTTGLLSPVHIALLLLVVIMLFGAKRLPELGRSVGETVRELRRGVEGSATDTTAVASESPAGDAS